MDVTLNSPILFYSRRASFLLSPACSPSSTHRLAACGVRPRRASVGRAALAKQRRAGGLANARASEQRRAAEQRRAGGRAKERARLQVAPGDRASGGRAAEPSSPLPPAAPPRHRRWLSTPARLRSTGSVLARALCWLGCRSSLSPCTLGARLCSENGAAGARRSARVASGTASAGPGHSTGAHRRLAAQAHLPSAPREVNISNSPSPLSDMVTGDAPIECFIDLMLLSN
jgi:hypothetical protein